jgi:putative copper export protein
MALVPTWLHLLGVVTWIGGLLWQAHVLAPMARRGDARIFATAARRAQPVTWTAISLVVLTGFYNVTRLGPAEQMMQTGAGLALAGKFILVLAAVSLAAQRDFALIPRVLRATTSRGEDPSGLLKSIAWLDRLVILLSIAIIYLGLFVSRAR